MLESENISWRDRLIARRYQFPPTSRSAKDLAVFLAHDEVGYHFPLATADPEMAAAKAKAIHQAVLKQGWKTVCREFSRELIVSFEWCLNPVLWTYTTIHTLVGAKVENEADPATKPNRQAVLVVEFDEGIRRALCWGVNHQPGFKGIPCDSAEAFPGLMASHKPRVVMLNRNLAGRFSFKSPGNIGFIRPGLPAFTYSAHADGDQMFASTPGGAEGYLVKRIKPDLLLEPILKVASRSELMTGNLLLRVKYYFQELLHLLPNEENSALAALTRREREVLVLLSKGCVDKEIAQAMGIGVWTVHGHVKSIFKRLGVRTRTEAVVRYLEK